MQFPVPDGKLSIKSPEDREKGRPLSSINIKIIYSNLCALHFLMKLALKTSNLHHKKGAHFEDVLWD